MTITFIDLDGRTVEAVQEPGSLMELARANGVTGVPAECGGALACATCHVIVADPWIARLTPPAADEEEMLACVGGRQPGSRLACQIELGPDLDGLVVHVAEN